MYRKEMRKVYLKKSERVISRAFYFLELRSFLSMNGREDEKAKIGGKWREIKKGLLVNECPQIICYECITPTSTFIMGNEERTLGLYTVILKD